MEFGSGAIRVDDTNVLDVHGRTARCMIDERQASRNVDIIHELL